MVALMCCCCKPTKPKIKALPGGYLFRLQCDDDLPPYYVDFCKERNLNWYDDGLFYIQLAIHVPRMASIYIICWAGSFFYLPIGQKKYVSLSDLKTDVIDPLVDDAFSRAFDLGAVVRSVSSDENDLLPASEFLAKFKDCANRLFSSALSVRPYFRKTDSVPFFYIPKGA